MFLQRKRRKLFNKKMDRSKFLETIRAKEIIVKQNSEVAHIDGEPIEIGRGGMDIVKVMKTLQKINYSGVVAIEFEKDGDEPLSGLAESVGYLRGIMKMV